MRLISILVAFIVAFSLYFLIVDRKSLIFFLEGFQSKDNATTISNKNNESLKSTISKKELPFVIVKKSVAIEW